MPYARFVQAVLVAVEAENADRVREQEMASYTGWQHHLAMVSTWGGKPYEYAEWRRLIGFDTDSSAPPALTKAQEKRLAAKARHDAEQIMEMDSGRFLRNRGE